MKRLMMFVLIFPCLATLAVAASQEAPRPRITFDATTVRISQIAPGESVVVFGIALVRTRDGNEIRRWQRTLDDPGRTGRVALTVKEGVPPRSTWAAVEIGSGRYAVAAPFGTVMARPFERQPIKNDGTTSDAIVSSIPNLEVLYVQPGRGAWTWGPRRNRAVARGSGTALPMDEAVPLTSFAAPPELVPGGLLIGIDRLQLGAAVSVLDEQTIRGAQ